jgi:hypothetical protein
LGWPYSRWKDSGSGRDRFGLRELGLRRLYLNHCTGQRAYVTLAQAFSEVVAPVRWAQLLNSSTTLCDMWLLIIRKVGGVV